MRYTSKVKEIFVQFKLKYVNIHFPTSNPN